MMWDAVWLIVAALGGAFVFDAWRTREHAVRVAREACRARGLQLLDDTVQGVRTSLARDAEGLTRFRRTYVFEFSDDRVTRRAGSLVMLGAELESFQLEPYRMA
jgi:Protein of unknown function (DUF3301)